MTGVITTGSNPKALWPGVLKFWGMDYEKHSPEWKDLFDEKTSDKAYEEVVEMVGTGLAQVKPEGESITYDTQSQGNTTRFTNIAYALGIMVTHEERKDNLYMEVLERRIPDLRFSMEQTHETVSANVYNRAFSGSYLGADGVSLCSTAHPTMAGNQANRPTAGADLSETSLEDLCIQIYTAADNRGRKIKLMPQSLHVHPNDVHEATRILESVLQNDTANNAVNALKVMGMFPGGVKMNHYFTDADAYFIRTNRKWSMLHFQREALEPSDDGDHDTKNLKYAAYERYSMGWGDWRGVFGNPGA
jgi:hypothetical protein